MSISVNCPTCGKAYNLNESMVGKKVRCKHCADTFPVELDAVLPVGDGAAIPGEGATQFQTAHGSKLPTDLDAALPDVLPADVTAADGVTDKEKGKEKQEPKKKGFPVFWCVAGGLACVVLLLCGGITVGMVVIIRNVYQTANNISNTANNITKNAPGTPAPRPKRVADAVADLNSGNSQRQQQAAEWLEKEPVNAADQGKVGKALEALLNDVNAGVKTAVANALVNWAGTANVPALIKCIEAEDPHTTDAAVKALVKVGDARAVAPIARLLPTNRRGLAANALQSFGPVAAPEVVKFAFHRDQGTRDEAQRLLKAYKTSDEVLLEQAIKDLSATDANQRMSAAQWLAKAPLIPKRRDQVSVALNPVLKDTNEWTRNSAVNAVGVWATKANVPTLIELLNAPAWYGARDLRGTLFNTLADLKDDRAAAVFSKDLANRDWHIRAKAALEALGAAAEPEVLKVVNHPDPGTRDRAAELLRKYGTKDDVLAAQALVDLKSDDGNRRHNALSWLAQAAVVEKCREEVAAALNPLLKDKSPAVHNLAVKALSTWVTKANVPTLIELFTEPNAPRFAVEQRNALLKALADQKDERAVAVFCKELPTDASGQATAGLEALGQVAEPEVLKYLHHPDAATRKRAADLLKKYGTKDEVLFKQAITDLKGPEAGRKQGAAATLASLPVDEPKRADVAAALEPLLKEKDANVLLAALKAAKVWATKENVPTLVKYVNDSFSNHNPPEQTWLALEVLIDLKDERAYWPVTQYAGHAFQHVKGRMYAEKLGSAAEEEVAKRLTDKDAQIRQRAWAALGMVGTKANLDNYQKLAASENNGLARNLAAEAVKAIGERK